MSNSTLHMAEEIFSRPDNPNLTLAQVMWVLKTQIGLEWAKGLHNPYNTHPVGPSQASMFMPTKERG